jgi:hypothetical protein
MLIGTSVKCPEEQVAQYGEKIVGLVEGVKAFDEVFSGRLVLLFKLLREILEFNYGDFIGALAGKAE